MKSLVIFLAAILIAGCSSESQKPNLAVVGLAGGDTVMVAVADTFSATFMIRGAKNVYAINALVNYDTTYLSAIKTAGQVAERGNFLGANAILQTEFVGNIAGTIIFAYSKQTNIPGSDGEGDLWKISMLARRPGLTKIGFDLSRCYVVSPNEIAGEPERLPARFDDKFVRIEPETVPPDTTNVPPDTVAVIYIFIE